MVAKLVIPMAPKKGRKYDIVKLVEWKVKEEDWVEKGNVVLAVETEKASYDIEPRLQVFSHFGSTGRESNGKLGGWPYR